MKKPIYHIVVQGVHNGAAFRGDLNKEMYWERIVRYKNLMGLELYAFVIFDNHAHFLVRGTDQEITSLMRRTGVSFSHWYRRAYNHEGSLFRGRPAMEMLSSDNEVLKAARFIHQEPVRRGLVEHMENYVWSSYWRYKTNVEDPDHALDKDEITERLRYWGRFEDYMSIKETGTYLREKEVSFGFSDTEVMEKIEYRLQGHDRSEFAFMPVPIRNYLLALLRFEDKVSILQLARVSGVGRGIIQRITKDDLKLRLYRETDVIALNGEQLPEKVMDDYRHWNVLEDFPSVISPGDILLPYGGLQKGWAVVHEENAEIESKILDQAERIYKQESGFEYFPSSMIYTERELRNGKVRRGLIARLDLEAFSLAPDAHSPVRLLQEIELPEVMRLLKEREKRIVELPNVVLAVDDTNNGVLGPLTRQKEQFKQIYNFELLKKEGRLRGYLLPQEQQTRIMECLNVMMDPRHFAAKYHTTSAPFLLTVLAGANALAAASMHYEQLKVKLGEEARSSFARFVLVEIVNWNDPAVELKMKYPVLKGADGEAFLHLLTERYPETHFGQGAMSEAHMTMQSGPETVQIWIPCKKHRRIDVPHPMRFLQPVLNRYLEESGAVLTFVDSREEAVEKGKENGVLSLSWTPYGKRELFDRILKNRIFPQDSLYLNGPRAHFEMRVLK